MNIRDIISNGTHKLTYNDVAQLFDVTVPIINRAYQNAKKNFAEETKTNGMPFTFSKMQIQILSDWIKSNKEPPHIKQVKNFITNEVSEELDNKT